MSRLGMARTITRVTAPAPESTCRGDQKVSGSAVLSRDTSGSHDLVMAASRPTHIGSSPRSVTAGERSASGRRGSHWSPRLIRVAIAQAALAAALGAQEAVVADVDLAGWRRLGVIAVDTPPRVAGRVEALFDDNSVTVFATDSNPARFLIDFPQRLVVRRVRVTPGGLDACEVRLTVVEADGSRFAAGEFVVDGGGAATFGLRDVNTRRLEIEVERLGDGPVSVGEIDVRGLVTIEALSLENVPETLPEGGSFPIRVVGRDSLGGRPELTGRAQLNVQPARALALAEGGRAVTLVGGPISISPRIGSLEGARRDCLVRPLAASPPAPGSRPGWRVAELLLEGTPPFEVLRRNAGVKQPQRMGRTESNVYVDDSVAPGQAYQYSYRRIDGFGNPLGELSAESRVRTHSRKPAGMIDPGRFPLLVVLFSDSLPDGEVERLVDGIDAARRFIYLQSRGRFLLDPTYLAVDGPTPVTAGPTMGAIEARLRALGVGDDQFGMVFAVAGDLSGSYSGFTLLGDTAGAMGRPEPVPTPPGAMGGAPGMAWSFAHEVHHLLELDMAPAVGIDDWPSGHYANDVLTGRLGSQRGRPFDAGEAWDGLARLFADFDAWEQICWPRRRTFETVDSDGDGLADDDRRLPLDERRFGSDPAVADTDGDGLDDLAEAAAGLYASCNPRHPDTDGDGLADGDDPAPLIPFAGVIPYGDQPVVIATLPPRRTTPPGAQGDELPPLRDTAIELRACWNEQGITLRVSTDRACDVFLDLDGSGRLGRWETDGVTRGEDAVGSDVWCGPARIALRAHHAPQGVFVGRRPVPGAFVGAERQNGRYVLTAFLPERMGPGAPHVHAVPDAVEVEGLRLVPGTVVGLGVTVRSAQPNDPLPLEAFQGDWRSLFETHRLLDAELRRDE